MGAGWTVRRQRGSVTKSQKQAKWLELVVGGIKG